MKIFPALLDSRPAYFEDPFGRATLLLAPMGTGTLLCELHARLGPASGQALTVIPTFMPTREYEHAIRSACSLVRDVTPIGDFVTRFGSYDLTDWLLFADPACFPLEPLDWESIVADVERQQYGAVHIVALDANPGGTTERVQLDRTGRVHRIQRYYDTHTWAFTRGIVCSFVPVSALIATGCTEFGDLRQLRHELARRGVPSRDLPLPSAALDLERERSLLWLSERCILGSENNGRTPAAAPDAMIDPSARLVGSVIVQPGAVIEADAQVIGPTVVGPDARIGRGAIVAQCMVARGTRVAAASISRHRALSGRSGSPSEDTLDAISDLPLDPPPAEAAPQRIYPALKLALDVVAAALGLIVLSPFLLLVSIIIKLESKGPVLYGDERETIAGRPFRCWKFRTMYQGAQAKQRELLHSNMVDGPQFKIHKDPRVTRVGRWLRGYNIDELPQLINVVRGEMSLVGPRPSPFRENQICIPWREGRLSVRAGITGLWQVCREQRKAGDFHQWILYDLLYVRYMSPLLDVRILIATALTLLGGRHVSASWVLGERRNVRSEGETGADRVAYDSVRV